MLSAFNALLNCLIALFKLICTFQSTIVRPLLHSSTLYIGWTEIRLQKIMSCHLVTAIKINLCAYFILNCSRLGGHVQIFLDSYLAPLVALFCRLRNEVN